MIDLSFGRRKPGGEGKSNDVEFADEIPQPTGTVEIGSGVYSPVLQSNDDDFSLHIEDVFDFLH